MRDGPGPRSEPCGVTASDSLLARAGEAIAAAEWKRAESILRRLLRGKDAPAQAAYNLALVLAELGKGDQSGAWFAKAVKRDPDYASAWFEYGRWLLDRGRLADARQAFEAVVRLEPDAADAWRNLGRLRERLAAFEDSLEAWGAVARLAGGSDTEAELGTLRALLELRRPEASDLRARLAADPDLRPALLKVLTRTSAGTLPLDPARLSGERPPRD